MIYYENKKIPWKSGFSLQDFVLMEKVDDPSILICLNEVVIHRRDWTTTFIPDDGRIIIIPMMSGG